MSRKEQCAARPSGLPALSMSSGVRVARADLGHGFTCFCMRSTSGGLVPQNTRLMATAVNPVRAEPITVPLASTPPVSIGTHGRYHWTKWALAVGVVITLAVVGELWRMHSQTAITYETVLLERGPVQASVIATGAVNAVVDIQLGSQVSGNIKALYHEWDLKKKVSRLACAAGRSATVLPEWLKLKMTPCLVQPLLFPIGQAEVPRMLSENAYFADFSRGHPMNNSNNDINNLRQLAHILADAYGNALMHDSSNADLEAKDLLLESASIRFSSRMLYEITKGSCQPDEHAATGALADGTCVLDDESVGLKGLTDMLSYAAFRLGNLGRSAPPVNGTNGQPALVVARVRSMEHLYRMVFALSRIYLDASQRGVYLETAREQLRLARKHMEIERSLCACSGLEHTAQLQELSELGDQLKDMRDDVARP
jgi:hypothetical protein